MIVDNLKNFRSRHSIYKLQSTHKTGMGDLLYLFTDNTRNSNILLMSFPSKQNRYYEFGYLELQNNSHWAIVITECLKATEKMTQEKVLNLIDEVSKEIAADIKACKSQEGAETPNVIFDDTMSAMYDFANRMDYIICKVKV